MVNFALCRLPAQRRNGMESVLPCATAPCALSPLRHGHGPGTTARGERRHRETTTSRGFVLSWSAGAKNASILTSTFPPLMVSMRIVYVYYLCCLYISQCSVLTQFRCGMILDHHFIANSAECASEKNVKIGKYLSLIHI